MTRFEYLEVDLHGDSGVRVSPDLGEGREGYIAKLNEYGKAGWEMVWLDRDTTVHLIAILKRETPDGK